MLDLRETTSGVVGATFCVYSGLPFDVIKVRLQTQSSINPYYNGVLDAARKIAGEEGVRALWKGAVPALSSSMIENSVLFSANGIVKRFWVASFLRNDSNNLSTLDEALIGSAAGIFSATAITPAEVVKCRLQFQRSQIGKGEFHGPIDCVQKVFRQEGTRGLFRGYSALLLRDVPFNFFFFGCYEFYTSTLMRLLDRSSRNELHPGHILFCGGLSGATGWSLMFPVDVLKSQMQTAALKAGASTSLRGTLKHVVQTHGVRGLYQGWSAAVLRAFPANGALFLGVEMTHRFFRATGL